METASKIKSLAELKRQARTGQYEAKMIFRYGKDIPEQMQGWRRIVTADSVGIYFLRPDGNLSELRLEKASLVEYDGAILTVFQAGRRSLNEAEKTVMEGWLRKRNTDGFREQEMVDALTDESSTYFQEISYFANAGYEYLAGHKKQKGLRYELHSGLIIDDKIKGDVEFQYEVRAIR